MNELIALGRSMAEAYEFKEKRKDGFWAKQKAVVRASTGSKSGIIGIKHAGMQKQNLKGQMRGFGKGAAVGGAAGATIGALMKGRGSSFDLSNSVSAYQRA